MTKIAVFFPGIGYTCDKPLLYYSERMTRSEGFEIKRVEYGGFASGIKGSKDKMAEAFLLALSQAEDILSGIGWENYDEILFISKSIGTLVSNTYAARHGLAVRSILYTPLEETYSNVQPNTIAFHGTGDPWAETNQITRLSQQHDIPLYTFEHANHSLETGDTLLDIRQLQQVMEISKAFIQGK